MKRKILFVAPHPDDESLGCGGTILKHKNRGDRIYWVIATDIKEGKWFSEKDVSRREKEIKLITKAYGFNKVYRLGILTTEVDKFPIQEIVRMISGILNEVRPDTVYLPFRADVHSDHRIIFEAAYSCTKTFRNPFLRKILMMETISETEFSPSVKECGFIPNYFVDISAILKKKIDIIRIYKSEIGKHPFPRNIKNIKALASFRGAIAGCKHAESFVLLKEID